MAIFDFTGSKDELKFKRQLEENFFKEQLDNDPFKRYMGGTGGSMVAVQKSIAKKSGTEIVFSLQYNPKVNEVYDEETIAGKGTLETPVNCAMNVGKTRFIVGAKDYDIAEFKTVFDFFKSLYDQLSIKRDLLYKRRNINQFAWCFASGSKGKNDHKSYDYILGQGQVTSDFTNFFIEKIKNCPINALDAAGNGISSDRVLFGAESIRNVIAAGQTIQERCVVGDPAGGGDRIGTADYADTSGYCSVDHLSNLIEIAKKGGRKINTEANILPMKYINYEGHQGYGYTYFVSPRVGRRLLKSPLVKELLIRPFKEQGQPTYFNGTNYIGKLLGTDIVIIDEFEYLDITTDAGADIGYGALCGQNFLAKAVCVNPTVKTDEYDMGNQYEASIKIIDGLKVIKFPSKRYQNVNNFPHLETGIVHSFTLI